jgi:TonB family protein
MKKERKDESFLKNPFYKGGDKALRLFIQNELKYPESAKAIGLEGSVPIRYDINHKGDVTHVHLLSSLHPDCDAEAIRVVKLLKFEVPKAPRNLKVVYHKNIVIHFNHHLTKNNPPTPQTSATQYQIQYKKSSPDTEKEKEKPSPAATVYSYTINLS